MGRYIGMNKSDFHSKYSACHSNDIDISSFKFESESDCDSIVKIGKHHNELNRNIY